MSSYLAENFAIVELVLNCVIVCLRVCACGCQAWSPVLSLFPAVSWNRCFPQAVFQCHHFQNGQNMPALPFLITKALFLMTHSLLSLQVARLFLVPHVYQQSTFVQIRFWDEISLPVPSLANNFIAHSYHEHCQVFSHGVILFHEWLVRDRAPECFPSYDKTVTI